MTDLSGRIALVTGASRGIGRAVALELGKAGAHVIALARTQGALEELDDEVQAAGGKPFTLLPVDLRRLEKLDNIGPSIHERFGKLDIFVGNAGILGTLGPLAHANPKDFQKVMDVNVMANFRLIRSLDPLLQAAEGARVVFTGSFTYNRPRAYWGAYRMSKAAVNMMALTYAAETEKTNMRVNIVHPSAVETALLHEAYPGGYPDDDAIAPEDVAQTIVELCSPSCSRHGEVVTL